MSNKKVIVVGAGPAGLTAAWELAEKGIEVTVLESDSHYVGGLARTVQWRGFRFDIGGHRFFSKNPDITRWWRERLGADFIQVKRLSRIIYNGHFFDYPLKPWNALSQLGIGTSLACVVSFLRRQIFPIRPERSFEDWISNRFGDRLYRIFFKTYTEKVWGIPCTAISADWASQRIQGLSLARAVWNAFGGGGKAKTLIDEFDYPRHGAGMMWEKTRDDILARNGRIIMGRTVTRLERHQQRVMAVWTRSPDGSTERHEADEFIVSMPLKDCINCLDEPIAEPVRAAASQLSYRAFIVVLLVVERTQLFPDNWIYVHSPEVKVGRIQNFNNWGDGMVGHSGVTSLELEYFCNEGDELWRMSDAQLLALARKEIQQLGLARSEEISDGCVARADKAYPVYDANYRQNVKTIREALGEIDNLQAVGRNGMHKYNNQDHSMLTGKLAAENAAGNGTRRYDAWQVNTDAEYLEAGNRGDESSRPGSGP
jgi:protoporphyrinogen oxidase